MNEVVETAKKHLERLLKIRNNTLYSFVYTDLDMKCIEILLYYIDELEAKVEFKESRDG